MSPVIKEAREKLQLMLDRCTANSVKFFSQTHQGNDVLFPQVDLTH